MFLDEDPYKAWEKWVKSLDKPPRQGLKLVKEFATSKDAPPDAPSGVHALPIDYGPMKAYVQKAQDVVSFEQEGNCVICREQLDSGRGLQPMCPNEGCEAMGHLDCWSQHALKSDVSDNVLPDSCECPSCAGQIFWADMMKELSLRVRGKKEITKLLKTGRKDKQLEE